MVRDDLSAAGLVAALSGPGVEQGIRVTVPEGYRLSQIGRRLEAAGIADRATFLALATDRVALKKLGLPGSTAEGYLFPDTYFFDDGAGAEQVIQTMYGQFVRQLARLGRRPGPELPPVVILASIVQAEAKVKSEMPVIAGVYHNRLTGAAFPTRLLQADPTVAYGCEPLVRPRAESCDGFQGVLSRAQLGDAGNPYNTYLHPGLPPGPICAPGLDALGAALKPADVPYFYFVVKGGGRHAFSVTLDEHHRAVRRYRQGR